jgi:hypothetical protein
MEKITRAQLNRRIENLTKCGFDLNIESGYGKVRLTNKQQSQNYTPLCSTRELYTCADAFTAGVDCERKRTKEQYPDMLFILRGYLMTGPAEYEAATKAQIQDFLSTLDCNGAYAKPIKKELTA